jgi:molybdopterin synthase sulfur carrier subunit
MAGLTVRVRYFAALREALGAEEQLQMPSGATVGDLRERLRARGEREARLLDRGRAVRCALDQVMSDDAAALHEGCEVAFFPPVTGG